MLRVFRGDISNAYITVSIFEVAREPTAGSGKKCLKIRQPVPEGLLNRTGKKVNFDTRIVPLERG